MSADPSSWSMSCLRQGLVVAGGIGFLMFTTAIERLAEHGKLSTSQVTWAFGLLSVSTVGLLLTIESELATGVRPRAQRIDLHRATGCSAAVLAGALFLTGSAWAFVQLQRETGAWAVDLGGFRAPVLAALVATATALIGAAIGLATLDRRLRDPEKVPQVTRARILALRAEGKTLKEVVAALDAAKLTAPGGTWTGRLLRGVIRSAPRRPPPA